MTSRFLAVIMPDSKATILRFSFTTSEHPMAVMARFFPRGNVVLNRSEWYAKEPRSCGITNVKSRPKNAHGNEPTIFDIEVTYRPKGHISFVGPTKYDGWTALLLDRNKDGELLDGHGGLLPEGQSPVYLPREVHEEIEFNELDFGQFLGESELGAIPHIAFDSVVKQIENSSRFSASINSSFMAERRHRPSVKIVLSKAPSGIQTDGFGTRIVNVNAFTPHLQQVLLNELTELVSGFIEGRYSFANLTNYEIAYINIDDSFVDCTPNDEGKESRFNCLREFVPDNFLEDLAKRLIATYKIEVSIVDGSHLGLLLRAQKSDR